MISLKGTPFASMAIDEAHESTINKDIKMAMSKGGEDHMAILSQYLPFRGCMLDNFKSQILHKVESCLHDELRGGFIDTVSKIITNYIDMINEKCSPFPSDITDRALINIFTGKSATNEQRSDLLSYHESGKDRVKAYIEYNFSKNTSTKVHFVRKNLKTFAVKPETVAKLKTAPLWSSGAVRQ